jgi:hypothetical protein
VWSEDRGTGTGLDIYGARVTRSGIVAGTEIPIIVKNGDQSDPALAFSVRNCAYLLVYTDDGGDTWSEAAGASVTVRNITHVDENTVYACGSNEDIMRSLNGGENWLGNFDGNS